MKTSIKNYSNIMSLVYAILFFILGAVIFTKPEIIILAISYVFGGIMIVIGLFKCIKNYLDIKKDNTTSSKEMLIGIILSILGLSTILLADVLEALVRLVIGGWILFSGITRLINTIQLSKRKKSLTPSLIISFLLIGIGVYTILEANLAFQALGVVLIIYSVIEIVGYIFSKKNFYIEEEIIITSKEDTIETKLLEETKEKKKRKK